MKERRGGPIGRLTGIADDVASALRRRQQERRPRAVLYDADGHPTTLDPESEQAATLLDTAERMLSLVDEEQRRGQAE